MSKLDDSLRLNQISIPCTHDSGTYAFHLDQTYMISLFRKYKNAFLIFRYYRSIKKRNLNF